MKYSKINFKNIGPIKTGEIKRNKINLFFGPNNSGKSIASRIIYGIGQLDTESSSFKSRIRHKISKNDLNFLYGQVILNKAGLHSKEIRTHNQKKATLLISHNKKSIEFNLTPKSRHQYLGRLSSIYSSNAKSSIYIPAGRTGIIQFLTSMFQIRNQLYQSILGNTRGNPLLSSKQFTKKENQNIDRWSLDKVPVHLEQFHNLMADAYANKLNNNTQNLFSKLFPGKIDVTSSYSLPEIIYEDPTGFRTDIESAGSGALSSFPIIAGVYYIKTGGTLIVETPEADLEPDRQLKLLEELITISNKRKIDLVFTTHSDYVVKKLLALVSRKKIKHTDLGMYYFNRPLDELTTIEKIDIDPTTGEAEQPLFDKALDTLVDEFSE